MVKAAADYPNDKEIRIFSALAICQAVPPTTLGEDGAGILRDVDRPFRDWNHTFATSLLVSH